MKKQNLDELVALFSAHFKIEHDFYKKKSQKKEAIYHKQLFHYLAYKNRYGSFEKIGEYCGFNHATILNSVKRVKGYASYEKRIINDIKNLQNKIDFSQQNIMWMRKMLALPKEDLEKVKNLVNSL